MRTSIESASPASFVVRLLSPLAIAFLLLGCERAPTTTLAPAISAPANATFPREFTDTLGRKVVVERKPERIVSLTPAVTEILYAVGAGPNVVATTTYCTYPPEAQKLPHVGGFMPKTINLEAVLAERPDVVFATGRLQKETIDGLAQFGLTVIAADANSFEETERIIELIARACGRDDDGTRVAGELARRVEAVKTRVAARSGPKPRVLYVVSNEPLFVAGATSLLGRMVEAAGGENVFGDVQQFYPRVGDEEVLKRAPEVILGPEMHGGDELKKHLLNRPGWATLPAVKNDRFRFIDEDIVSRPCPRMADGLEAIERAIHATNAGDASAPAATGDAD